MDTRTNAALRGRGREDERRRREETLVNSLQQQVDELRHQFRDQGQRQLRVEEQLRNAEARGAQLRGELEEARQELTRVLQLRSLEDQRTRQQVADALTRLEDVARPIRALQSQMNDTVEFTRQFREQVTHFTREIEGVRGSVDNVRAESLRASDLARGTREAMEGVQQSQATHTRDLQHIGEQGRLIEHEVRRQLQEMDQRFTDFSDKMTEIGSYRQQLVEMLRRVEGDVGSFPAMLDSMKQQAQAQELELEQLRRLLDDRLALVAQRADDTRDRLAHELAGLASALEDTAKGLHQRVGSLDDTIHQAQARISELDLRSMDLREFTRIIARGQWRIEERLVQRALDEAQAAWEDLQARRQQASEEE